MSFSKTFFIVLSVLLCLSLLSKQASAGYALDYDIPCFVDIPHVEAYNAPDSNEPTTLVVTRYIQYTPTPAVVKTSLQDFYLQPDPRPALRPPRQSV